MRRSLIAGRLLAVLVAGGVLAIAQLGAPSLVNASPAIRPVAYPAGVVTTTKLWLDHPAMRAGEANTAHVKVSSSVGTPQGIVTFRVGTHQKSAALVNGEAAYAIPTDLAPGTYRVSARYDGRIYRPSSDTAYLTVANSDNTGASGAPGGTSAGRAAPTQGTTSAGLPATGADGNTGLFLLIGLGLVALGGFNLMGHRRRLRS